MNLRPVLEEIKGHIFYYFAKKYISFIHVIVKNISMDFIKWGFLPYMKIWNRDDAWDELRRGGGGGVI